jgi:hypothetical protein
MEGRVGGGDVSEKQHRMVSAKLLHEQYCSMQRNTKINKQTIYVTNLNNNHVIPTLYSYGNVLSTHQFKDGRQKIVQLYILTNSLNFTKNYL